MPDPFQCKTENQIAISLHLDIPFSVLWIKATGIKSGSPWNFPSTFKRNQSTARSELILFIGMRLQRNWLNNSSCENILRLLVDCKFNIILLCETSENNTSKGITIIMTTVNICSVLTLYQGIVQRAFCALTHLILLFILWGRYYHQPHFFQISNW